MYIYEDLLKKKLLDKKNHLKSKRVYEIKIFILK